MNNSIFGGPGLAVSNITTAPYVSISGPVMWDGATQRLVVVSTTSQQNLTNGPITQTISLDQQTLDVIAWAKKKMADEKMLDELCAAHVGLKDLRDKYEVMVALVKQNPNGS